MAKQKSKRAGGKFTGSHSTVVPAAASIADVAHACEEVTKIALGFIKANLPSAKGRRALKISQDQNGTLLLSVRDNTTHQELRVYTTNKSATINAIAAGAAERGFAINVTPGPQ